MNVKPSKCPHILVKIVDSDIEALLDSGAEISVMNSIEIAHKYNFKVHKTNIKIDTAGTANHSCLGFINVPLTYKSVTRVIRIYIVLEFSKPLILGVNFWKAFNIVPAMKMNNKEIISLGQMDCQRHEQVESISLVENYFSADESEIALRFLNLSEQWINLAILATKKIYH